MKGLGYPVQLSTIQKWEIGQAPSWMAVKVLEEFLKEPPVVNDPPIYPKQARIVKDKDVVRIRNLREHGKTLKGIAVEFGISELAVSRICAKNRHK
jgi:hypothetical protein